MKIIKEEFYPTPRELITQMTKGIRWMEVHSILEPSAGKGDIIDFIQEEAKYQSRYNGHNMDVDCIELDEELRCTLKGKEYRVVCDDFLRFQTMKQYDLIIMNPPFSNGVTHLLKALDMQKDGGAVVCILNAETLKNPYSNERKVLVQKLQDLGAEISYIENAFITAERPTGVEIALVRVFIERKEIKSEFYEEMKRKYYREESGQDPLNEVAPNDFVAASVAMYQREVGAGVKLIREYKALSPYILGSFKKSAYNHPMLTLKCGSNDASVNEYVKMVREKYWEALFKNPKFTENMTSNLIKEYSSQVQKLKEYDFSEYNIKCIQLEMSKNLIRGIEDCIIYIFDELSHQYSYYDTSKNIHLYNGWKTNKAWIINKKVILPINAYSNYSKSYSPDYYCKQKLADIEKALNYLDGGRTPHISLEQQLIEATREGNTKKIDLKYFYLTFYKKGTCHIEFKDEELLKKLNIFGSQQKKWLPPSYGKRRYSEMSKEEQEVVQAFDGGEISYQKILNNAEYFIYEPKNSILQIEQTA